MKAKLEITTEYCAKSPGRQEPGAKKKEICPGLTANKALSKRLSGNKNYIGLSNGD